MKRRDFIKLSIPALLPLVFPLIAFKKYNQMEQKKDFEAIIIGGSYAGLSAAMALGRSLRNVLVIDSGMPCNRSTPHSHNFITNDGEKPHIIAAKAREEVLKYTTVQLVNDLALSGKRNDKGFVINTASGKGYHTKKLVFATGIKDILPDIKGFAECWGISVVHCPYCHGYELRNKKTAIMANGEKGFHLASLVNNLTKDLTILTSGKADFTDEQLVKLKRNGIRIIESRVAEIKHNNGYVSKVALENGDSVFVEGLYAALPFVQHSDMPFSFGCDFTEQGYIKTDGFQRTTVAGIYACGDNSAMMRSVANAVYSGNVTGAMVNKELTDEQF